MTRAASPALPDTSLPPESVSGVATGRRNAVSLLQKVTLMNVDSIIDEMQTMRKKDVRLIGKASREILGEDKSSTPLTEKIMRLLAGAPDGEMHLKDIKRHLRNYHTVEEVAEAVNRLHNVYEVAFREPDDSIREYEQQFLRTKNKGGRKPICGDLIVQRLR